MVVLSKPSNFKWLTPLPYTCHEVIHTWDPSCLGSLQYIGYHAVKNCFIIYVVLYGVKYLFRLLKKKNRSLKTFKQFLSEVFQSSIFMGVHGISFVGIICLLHKLTGKIYGEFGFITGLSSAAISLWIENINRRQILAMYLGNLSFETVCNMLIARNIIKPISNFQLYAFSLCVGSISYIYKSNRSMPTSFPNNIHLLLGENDDFTKWMSSKYSTFKISNKFDILNVGLKCSSCLHTDTLIKHAVKGAVRNGIIGFAIDVLLNLKSKISTRKSRANINFQLTKFMSSFMLIYRLSECLLRLSLSENCTFLKTFLPGFFAGLTSIFYQSSSLTIYLFFKLIQSLYIDLVERKLLPHFPNAYYYGYSIAFATLFHALIFEPHTIRPSYYRFMCRLSNNKFHNVFRQLLDDVGVNSSALNPGFIPELKPQHVKSEYVLKLIANNK